MHIKRRLMYATTVVASALAIGGTAYAQEYPTLQHMAESTLTFEHETCHLEHQLVKSAFATGT